MQIRCQQCHRPFALGREAVHQALDVMKAENLNHYTAHCPHCRRANKLSYEELLRAAPDWQKPKESETPT